MSVHRVAYQPDVEQERKEILQRYKKLIEAWYTRKTTKDRWMVRKAFRMALDAHKDMRRRSGEPYIFHPLDVAIIAAEDIGLGRTSIIAALLHDVVEDTDYKLSDIEAHFGEDVARIIDGLTKIEDIMDDTSEQAENFRKILLTLSTDVRVILIKLADRLHNMRTLDAMPREKQLKIASETLFIYSPLALRLGLYAIKAELEDLSFKYTDPQTYQTIVGELEDSKTKTEAFIKKFMKPVEKDLQAHGINYHIATEYKSAYSVWQKMKKDEIPFEEVYNAFAIKVIIESQNEKIDCWKTYSLISDHYRPNIEKLKDWISMPKANGYEALHTTVMGPEGHWVEVLIRSRRMNDIAEKGYAAWFKYNEHRGDGDPDSGLEKWLSKIHDSLSSEDEGAIDFLKDFRMNLFSDEIFVFTPKGKMINLPNGATVLDFAYSIHTDLGNSCIGAHVNHKLVGLNESLKTGDQVQVITSQIQNPKPEWFNYVKTARAKTRIKSALREDRKKHREPGKQKLDAILEQLDIENNKQNLQKIIDAEKLSGLIDLYYFSDLDKIDNKRVKGIFTQDDRSNWTRYFRLPINFSRTSKEEQQKNGNKMPRPESILLKNDRLDLNYIVSDCCNPIPGDDVMGMSFENEPIQIHKTNCPKGISLMSQYGKNIIKAKWKKDEEIAFLAGLRISGIDSVGFINKLTKLISEEFRINIRSFHLESSGGLTNTYLTLYVQDSENLNELISRLKKLDFVKKVKRLETFPDEAN